MIRFWGVFFIKPTFSHKLFEIKVDKYNWKTFFVFTKFQQQNYQSQTGQFQSNQMRPSYPSPLHGIYSNSPHSSINGDAKPPNGASSRKSFTNGGFGQNPSSSVKSLNKYYDSDSNSSNKYWIFILDLLILVHFILFQQLTEIKL